MNGQLSEKEMLVKIATLLENHVQHFHEHVELDDRREIKVEAAINRMTTQLMDLKERQVQTRTIFAGLIIAAQFTGQALLHWLWK